MLRRGIATLLVAAHVLLLAQPALADLAPTPGRDSGSPATGAADGPHERPRGLQLLLADSTQQRSAQFQALGKYALVVGINEYQNKAQGISSLRFAVGDAEAVYRSLVDPKSGGFRPENVTLLTDNTIEKPTNTAIGKALNRLITQTNDSDLVVVYFSGHGYEEEGRAYLLPTNADLEALDYSAIERDAFVRQIDKIPAKKVVVVLDACHSGGVNRGGKGVGKDAALSQKYYDSFIGAQGRAFIASSSGGELSWEDDAAGHGVFTHALARGLAGAADTEPRDGIITLQELRKFLESQVSTWAGSRGKAQHPQINLESARGDIPLAINYAFFAEESHTLTSRRDEADSLRTGLARIEGLEPSETATALELVSRFGKGEPLSEAESQHLDFVRKLVDGSVDVVMYRAAAPKPRPSPLNAEQLGIGPRKRSLFSNPWFLGGVGLAAAGAGVALSSGSKSGGAPAPTPDLAAPPGPPPGN